MAIYVLRNDSYYDHNNDDDQPQNCRQKIGNWLVNFRNNGFEILCHIHF